MEPVEDLELVPVLGRDLARVEAVALLECRRDVPAFAERLLRRLRPRAQGRLRLLEEGVGLAEEPVVREGDARRAAHGELVQRVQRLIEVEVRRRGRGA